MTYHVTIAGRVCIPVLSFAVLYLALHAHVIVPYVVKFVHTLRQEKRDATLRARWGHARR